MSKCLRNATVDCQLWFCWSGKLFHLPTTGEIKWSARRYFSCASYYQEYVTSEPSVVQITALIYFWNVTEKSFGTDHFWFCCRKTQNHAVNQSPKSWLCHLYEYNWMRQEHAIPITQWYFCVLAVSCCKIRSALKSWTETASRVGRHQVHYH